MCYNSTLITEHHPAFLLQWSCNHCCATCHTSPYFASCACHRLQLKTWPVSNNVLNVQFIMTCYIYIWAAWQPSLSFFYIFSFRPYYKTCNFYVVVMSIVAPTSCSRQGSGVRTYPSITEQTPVAVIIWREGFAVCSDCLGSSVITSQS